MIKITDDRSIIEFGKGDIKIASAYINEMGMMSLNNCGVTEIGSTQPTRETVDSILDDSKILLTFTFVKSLEVVILKLQEIRAMMLGIEFDNSAQSGDITELYEPNSYIDSGSLL